MGDAIVVTLLWLIIVALFAEWRRTIKIARYYQSKFKQLEMTILGELDRE